MEPRQPADLEKRYYFKSLGEKHVHPLHPDLSRQQPGPLFLLIPPHSPRYTGAFTSKSVLPTDGNLHIMKHISQKKVEHEKQRNSSTSKHYSWEEEYRLYIGSA